MVSAVVESAIFVQLGGYRRKGRYTLYGHAGREKEGTHRAGCKLSMSQNQGWNREKRSRAAPTPATPPTTSPSFALQIALSTADYYRLGKPGRRVFQNVPLIYLLARHLRVS